MIMIEFNTGNGMETEDHTKNLTKKDNYVDDDNDDDNDVDMDDNDMDSDIKKKHDDLEDDLYDDEDDDIVNDDYEYHIEDSNDEENFYRYRFQQYLLSGLLVIRKKQVHEMYTLLIPHFYIVKLGHTGVHIVFLFLTQNIDCGYSLELPHGVV